MAAAPGQVDEGPKRTTGRACAQDMSGAIRATVARSVTAPLKAPQLRLARPLGSADSTLVATVTEP
jgi:hypothetical protein